MAKYNLEKIISVTGLPGLYRLAVTRSNGIVVEDFDNGKSRFLSVRKFQFAPLETIGIYTMTDTVELSDIFRKMAESGESNPAPDVSTTTQSELFDYFKTILPDFDKDRVFIGDVKKVIKWYRFLSQRNLLNEIEEETDPDTEEKD